MLSVPPGDPGEALLRWVREWLDLLAAGRLAEACALLDDPASDGRPWTPGTLVALVEDSYGPGTRFRAAHPEGPRFTPVAATRDRLRAGVGAFDDGRGYWVDHDVPLNGACSDLTARFEFLHREGRLAVALRELHVL